MELSSEIHEKCKEQCKTEAELGTLYKCEGGCYYFDMIEAVYKPNPLLELIEKRRHENS